MENTKLQEKYKLSKYIPLHCHSHYSLLDGLSKPIDIAKRCNKIGATSCAITDHGSISGNIQFYKTMTSNGIKPILGVEMYLSNQDSTIKDKSNQKLSHMLLLAKNLAGWKNLIKIVSASNLEENFYYKPRLDIEKLASFIDGNIIGMAGHPGSYLANSIYQENKFVPDPEILKNIGRMHDIFGSENFFVEIQLMDRGNEYQQIIGHKLRDICNINRINKVASIDAHYTERADCVDQRILLCGNLKTTLQEVSKKISNNEDFGLKTFFESDAYHILDPGEITEINTADEIDNTFVVDGMCERYDILSKPMLPKFDCGELGEVAFLRELCRQGWRDKIANRVPKEEHPKYVDRIKKELDILEQADLSSYFLVVRDIVQEVKRNGWLPGPGRGSAAGCLVSYLVDITSIDPMKYNLIFERFYNAGRNTKDRISMPDIDVDVPIEHRESIIDYIKNKYGQNKVAQMITFNTMKGRGALKEVLRVYNNISFAEMNSITKNIPDEAKIADDLQEMRDEDGDASIIKWALENNASKLKDWCYVDDNDNLLGPLSKRFEQAIRLEGTKSNQSKHAAGIAISYDNLSDMCPMIYDNKTGNSIAGLEMNDLESIGVVKFDILGIALLDKIMGVQAMLQTGENDEIL